MDDLDFVDLITVAEYDEEWSKLKRPIWRRVRAYLLWHDAAIKGVFVGTAGLALLLQYTPYGYLLSLPQWLLKLLTSMFLPAFGL